MYRLKLAITMYTCGFEKPRWRYILLTCLIPSSMFLTFHFLIIIPVANIMYLGMVFGKPKPLMCMGSHHRVDLLYLLRVPLGKFGTMIGSTCWILWRAVLPYKCGTLASYIFSATHKYSHKIRRFCRMLLSTACGIFFTG